MSCPHSEISLTERELRVLDLFRSEPFLPVARRLSSEVPYFLLDGEDYSDELMWLRLKGLVDVELSSPVVSYPYSEYPEKAAHGSASLTLLGQEALDTLDILGAGDD